MFGQNNQDKPDEAQVSDSAIENIMNDQGAVTTPAPANDWQHPGLPIGDAATTVTPADNSDMTANDGTPIAVTASLTGAPAGSPDDLIDIKQQALSQLAPLVDHLDQTPEEKFRTTMMMIQASDDQTLVKDAYT
ncbi:MAG: hypothetical protein ABIV43_00445, partial [Candidatus Saccharimonadales bacterium]